MKVRRKKGSLVATLFLAAVMGTSAYAFTASNTFTGGAGSAGDGGSDVSGYDVTNVTYGLDASGDIDTVDFDLDGTAANVQVALSKVDLSAASSLQTCSVVGTHASCPVSPSYSTLDFGHLRVVAAS